MRQERADGGFVVQIAKPIMTLEGFHDSLKKADGSETIALRTLEAHAKGGRLRGVYKLGSIWMVNMVLMLHEGYEPDGERKTPAEAKAGERTHRRSREKAAGAKTANERERLKRPDVRRETPDEAKGNRA